MGCYWGKWARNLPYQRRVRTDDISSLQSIPISSWHLLINFGFFSDIKGLLAARCKTTAKSARTTTTKRRRRRTTTASTTKADGTVVKRRYKRRKRRRRAPVRARTAAVKVAKPKKKTAEIAIQTSDYLAGDGEDDFPPMNVSVGTSNSSSTPRLKTKKKEQKGDIIDSKKKVRFF